MAQKMKGILCLLFQLVAVSVMGKVIPSSLISDNMVLQQLTEVQLWGMATPNAKVSVSVSWEKKEKSCRTDAGGQWCIKLRTPQGNDTPQSITFDDGEKTVISGILIGEVWLAAGQSNMEMPLQGFHNCPVKGSTEAIAYAGNHPQIRMFNVPRKLSDTPQTDIEGAWKVASPETAAQFSAAAYHFALSLRRTLHVPVGIINCSVGGSKIEGWTKREIVEEYADIDLTAEGLEKTPDYLRPAVFYNAMLHPTIPYALRGFIWYQGESNVACPDYALRMKNMVAQWREERQQGELPFYYVELAPFRYQGHQQEQGPRLREEQYKAQRLIPNCGMICTNDLVEAYESDNVHPANKEEIGKRLSYMALNRTYNLKAIPCYGPEFKSMEITGNQAKLTFIHCEMGFTRSRDVEGFEIAGADKVFYPADCIELHHSTWVISSDKVAHPVAVRYCFKDFQPGNIGGTGGLPMVPFRTDSW